MATRAGVVGTGSLATALEHAGRLLGTEPRLALAQARAVLEAVPGHPHARLIEAKALRLTGDLAGARALLVPLAAEQTRSAATALELGLTAAASGDQPLAIDSLRRACALDPASAPAWTALATILRDAGEDAEAQRADLAAVRASTKDPLLVKAAMALAEGRHDLAEPLLRSRLKSRPGDVAATRMLAEVAWRLGRTEDALTLLKRTLSLAPGFVAAREFYTRLLNRSNRVIEALEQATILLAQHPAQPSYAMLKASMLVRIGDQEGARVLYEGLLAHQPHQPKTWMCLGHVLKTVGRQAESVAAYRKAIAISPTLGEAWWSLANLKTVRFEAADIAAIRAAIAEADASEGGSNEDAFHLRFALGKALEDLGEDAAAFAAYAEANRLRRADQPYSADETEAKARAHAALFDRAFLAARSGDGCDRADPIFIVGLPRAGSTLIEQILASHSRIEGTMELPDLMMIAARLEARAPRDTPDGVAEVLRSLSPADRCRLGEEYLERTRIHRRTAKPHFIDKMPNNWQHVGLIQLILPNAKIIDARRHPMGCGFSAWKQHFARGQGFSYDLADMGRYYRDYVDQMAAFDEAAPGRVHRIFYEQMVADTRGEVERLLAYLGLPFEDGCLSFWRTDRAVRTASSEQVRQPIFTDGVDHWHRFAPWLGPLADALGPTLAAYPDVPPRAGR